MDVSVLISNRQKYETTKYDYNKIARRLMTAKKQVMSKKIGSLSQAYEI